MVTAAPKKKAAPKGKKKAVAKPKAKAKAKPAAKKAASKKAPAKKGKAGSPPQTFFGHLRRWAGRGAYYFCCAALVFFVITVAWVGLLRFVNPPVTGLMLMRHFGEGLPVDKVWRDYESVSPDFLVAVLAAEDQRFYDHHGFDVTEIRNAIEAAGNGGRMRGASTLSQQVAKNIFLWPSRSWWRKGAEVYFTVLVEVLWPKQRILEVYVNVAELGPGVYGVERAAKRYFDCGAAGLSKEQSALLASILPSPLKRFLR